MILAAFVGGVIVAIIQITNLSFPEKKIPSFDTTRSSVMPSNNSHYEKQNQYSLLVEELNDIKSELQNINDQQHYIQQTQENLSKSFLLFKDSQYTQNQEMDSIIQTTHIDPIEEENNEELQLSRIFSLDKQMRELDTDTTWESEALSTITNGFENINLEGSSLQTVECQGITCRIEVVHNSRIDAEVFFEDTFKIVPWNHRARIEIVEDENNGITSIYYATREES